MKAIRYLGVHIQDNLKWHTHIDMITTKSSTTLVFVKRTIPPQSSQLRIRAYKQLVRPVLEYASCSWDLLPNTISTRVEAVQRRHAWVVLNIPCVSRESATELLRKLDWAPLEERRSHRCMCLFRAMHFADFVVPNKKTGTGKTTFSTELSTIRPRLTCQHSLYKQKLEQAGRTTNRADSSAPLASPLCQSLGSPEPDQERNTDLMDCHIIKVFKTLKW